MRLRGHMAESRRGAARVRPFCLALLLLLLTALGLSPARAETVSYTYDDAGRLVGAQRGGGAGAVFFGYDAAGNLTTLVGGASGDSDGDGMSDQYEAANRLNPRADDTGGDADGDGFTNGEEHAAGTDPQDPDSTPQTGMQVTFGGEAVPPGGQALAGSSPVGQAKALDFTIANPGNHPLALDGSPLVSISGDDAADFSVTAQPGTSVAAGGQDAFTISFTPSALGLRTATLSIANTSDDDPYTFTVTGQGGIDQAAATWPSPTLVRTEVGAIRRNGNQQWYALAQVTGPAPPDCQVWVTAPDGTQTQLETLQYWHGQGILHYFSEEAAFSPGQYTIRVIDAANRVASHTITAPELALPAAPGTSTPDGGTYLASTTPTLSTEDLGGDALYEFRVTAYDDPEQVIYSSGRQAEAFSTVPAGLLQSGTTYSYHVVTWMGGDDAWSGAITTARDFHTSAQAEAVIQDLRAFTFTQDAALYATLSFRDPGLAGWDTGSEMARLYPTGDTSSTTYFWMDVENHLGEPARYTGTKQMSAALDDGNYTAEIRPDTGDPVTTTYDYAAQAVDPPADDGRSPANGAYLSDTRPTFAWPAVAGEGVRYRLRVTPYGSEAVAYESALVDALSLQPPADTYLVSCAYQWTVEAVDASGRNLGRSSTWYFTILDGTPTPPPARAAQLPWLGPLVNAAELDSDGDGIPDWVERQACTKVTEPDTDGDGIPDGVEDANHDGVLDAGETNPCDADSDGDGLDDGVEDANHDGVLDEGETDPRLADTDGDGMPDGYEVANGLNPRLDDAGLDKDGDGYSNLAECLAGTRANDAASQPGRGQMGPMLLLLFH